MTRTLKIGLTFALAFLATGVAAVVAPVVIAMRR